ncbi:MAG: hypothetical protein M1832_001868 [Thelocarpon impressellum]|nr:MAG: hypothetical protein M1832_001868 [Thelocarpon impressellum]
MSKVELVTASGTGMAVAQSLANQAWKWSWPTAVLGQQARINVFVRAIAPVFLGGGNKVRVTCLCPSVVDTPTTREARTGAQMFPAAMYTPVDKVVEVVHELIADDEAQARSSRSTLPGTTCATGSSRTRM